MTDASFQEGVNALASKPWRIGLYARRRVVDLFMKECRPNKTTTILDIGATEDDYEGANLLEKLYPWPQNITCATLGNGRGICSSHPSVHHVHIEPDAPLPFPDKTFDIAYSNAVLEHVGGPRQRGIFISEALRVSRKLFLAVPNKWFPVEHHTGIPLLHWSPALFRRTFAGGRFDWWSQTGNLDFLSQSTLRPEFPRFTKFIKTGLPLGPWSSNIAIVCQEALTREQAIKRADITFANRERSS